MIGRNRDSLELNKFVDSLSSPDRPGIVALNPDGSNIASGNATVAIGSSATLFAVVNTAAQGTTNSLVTLLAGPNQIGSVTVSNPVQLATGANYIGLASVNVGNTVNALASIIIDRSIDIIGSTNSSGLFVSTATGTSFNINLISRSGIPINFRPDNADAAGTSATNDKISVIARNTVFNGSTWDRMYGTTEGVYSVPRGNVTLNSSPNFIGLATVVVGSVATLFAVVNTGAVGITNSLTTLLAGPNQIGSVTISNNPTLGSGVNYIGLASINIGGTLPALTAGSAYIGLVSVSGSVGLTGLLSLASGTEVRSLATILNFPATQAVSFNQLISLASGTFVSLNAGSNYIGLATVVQANQPALTAGSAYIGLASVNIGGTLPALTAGTAYIGLASVNVGNTINANVSLSASSAFIGLATVIIGSIPTILTQPISYSFYQQSSLVSGYIYYGNAAPGSNPTQSVFRIQRESLNTGDVLFGSGVATFIHQWSSTSLASLTYL